MNFFFCCRYASSFRFAGDYIDKKALDHFKRRRTRIVAIDALCAPKMRHFKDICLLRYVKLFLGIRRFCRQSTVCVDATFGSLANKFSLYYTLLVSLHFEL